MSILVLAQHDNQQLHSSILNILGAASIIQDDIHLLVAGHQCQSVADQARTLQSVTKVLLADQVSYGQFLAENLAALVADIGKEYTHILGPATSFGKNILPRAAALLDVQAISDVISIESPSIFSRTLYAGNVLAQVESSDPIKVLSLRPSAFAPLESGSQACPIESLTQHYDLQLSQFTEQKLNSSERPELDSARVVVSGGIALGNSDNFELLYSLADRLEGAVGASRAAVDAGLVPNDLQVGQTGRVVAPDLYIAVGISGAIQHIAGIKDSKIIVAINKDEQAPIFEVADYYLVQDLFEAIPEMNALLA